MRKQDLLSIYSEIEPDEFMKQRIERKVLSMNKEKTTAKRVSFKRAAVLAVCIAITGGAVASLPVMAEYIPAVKNALRYFSSEESYIKDPVAKNDAIVELAETVDVVNADIETGISFNIQNVYYDGDDVLIYYVFQTDGEKFSDYNSITARFFRLFADGKEIMLDENEIISGGKCDDNTYAGMIQFSADALPDKDNLNMTIEISNVEMLNTKVYYFNYDADNPCYDFGKPDVYTADISCSFDMNRQHDLAKTYEINQTKEGITLNSVTITPVRTHLNMTMGDGYTWTLTDNNGNELEFLNMYDFDTPLKDAKTLTLSIKDINKNDFPEVCSFTFDIDGGYRNEDTYNNQTYNRDEITFIPSEEEADKWIAENRTVLDYTSIPNRTPANEWRDYDYDTEYLYGDDDINHYSIKISNVEYITNVNSLDLENCALSPYEYSSFKTDADGNILNGLTLVVYDYSMRNNQDNAGSISIMGGFARKHDIRNGCCGGDIYYIDKADNGGKSLLKYNLQPHEEKTVRVGRLVDSEAVEEGLVYIEDHGNYYDCIELD